MAGVEQFAEKFVSLTMELSQRLKPRVFLGDLRRGLKPRPFKAERFRHFSGIGSWL
jgi:hypothetical protein